MRICMAIVIAAFAATASAANRGTNDRLEQSISGLCPRPLGDDPAMPPTLRVAMLWRMSSQAYPTGGNRAGGHPSAGRMNPGDAAEAQKDPKLRLDAMSRGAGAELLAGRHDAARRQLDACLADATAQGDLEAEAACANNLGVLLAARGRYAEARTQLERAAARYRQALAQLGPAAPAAGPVTGLASLLNLMRDSQHSLERGPLALGVMRSSLNLGQLAQAVGQLAPAERHGNEALQAAAALPGACRAAAAADLARLYRRLERPAEADAVLARHPMPPKRGSDDEPIDGFMGDMGRVALAPSSTQAPTAHLPVAPVPGVGQFIAISDEPMSVGSEAALQALLAAAARDEQAGRAAQALAGYGRVALRAMATGRPEPELSARAGMMRLHAAAGRGGAAIAQGKRAVDLIQALHQGEGGAQLDRAARRALVRQRQQVHAQLVRLLIDRDRLFEAELVLRMLKQDEGMQFVREVAEAAQLPYSAAEQAAQARAGRAVAELQRLDGERRAGASDDASAMVLQLTRAGVEHLRLKAAADVVEFLRAPQSGRLEAELRGLPGEARPVVQRLMAGKGETLATALRHLAEDAPHFTETRAGAAELATVAEAARRAGEFHAAFLPVLARVMKEPALTGSEWERSRRPAPPDPQAMGEAVGRAVTRATASVPRVEQAIGAIVGAQMSALAGKPGAADGRKLEAALEGLPPEVLDAFASMTRQQGQRAAGQRRAVPGAADGRLQDVQRQIDAAVRQARAGAGPSLGQTMATATTPKPDADPADAFEGALLFIDVMERLWRLDQARERAEVAHLAADERALAALETPVAPAAGDDVVATLARQAPAAALLHFLPGDERTDVLVVTARGRRALRVAVPRAELGSQVRQLLAQLRQPRQDPRPVARALHDRLLAPVLPVLDEAGVQVLVLSLHDQLRFVPFAALHDGRRWLAERYAVVVHPGARLADLLQPTSPRWRVAAFGASGGGAGLSPLPAVPAEVRSVVGEGSASPRGRAWIDRAFDIRALRAALAGGHDVVHIASHFHFEPGDAAASFLLLGDGSRLSLQDLGSPEYRFDRLELVALSACQTGLSEDDSYGQEVDGLGALLMAQGARAVVASLWQVADDSTGELMTSLYRLREREGAPPLPLAQALQRAQLAMIRSGEGGRAGAETLASRGAVRRVDGDGGGAPAGRSHPYHWAPFVLMGNWR